MPEPLSDDMRELLDALNRWEVEYLVIGAHAVGVYTEPRGTRDLDIWVNPTRRNAKRALGALREFGAPLFGGTEKTLTNKRDFLVIGVSPNRIDVLKSIPGLEFKAAWREETPDFGCRRYDGPLPEPGRCAHREVGGWAPSRPPGRRQDQEGPGNRSATIGGR